MNIYESITKIIAEIPAISKDKVNKIQGFKYRGIDDVMNAIQPLLAKYRVFITPEVLGQTREERQSTKGGTLIYSICKIKYTFYAEDGSNVTAITIGEGMDSGDKATNKAMAIAMKYALFQVFCIPTDEMKDPDAETPDEIVKKGEEKISKVQVDALYNLIKTKGVENDEVIATLKQNEYEKLADIKVKDYMNIARHFENFVRE